ncbi:hypothetical protein SAMN05660489_04702 [Pseudomonas sp. LAMO17WK12:I10]|uniref:hypothetical protein n=1 Tax=unclassified Pseudomonas TaxID=196821 RepID=UPI000BC8BCA3|nr:MULTISPECIES: hypothetical protein [unclassified Pseudomonas]PXX58246.1 hypothetical protein H160_05049 [Pseudomonas sp. LAMO17WK12:I9]SNY47701.1 hypothetical protein SAMN05660489_04702 [Pseudomonas sp. LAMO17WK12:I10]
MAISLIRSLTASVVRNVSALKRDAKRLQKHSKLVFGTEYPLKICQQAVAVSRGFRSLTDVENLAQRLGMDKSTPFWTILSRNDTHQDVLDAIYRLNLEYTENGPVVFTGEQKYSVLPALVLFLEQMSFKKMPGLILIETEAPSIQDTLICDEIKKLEVEAVLEGFRSLDLRERNLPVSLCTEARCWVNAITDVLPMDLQTSLNRNGWSIGLEVSARENAKSRHQVSGSAEFAAIPFFSVKEAAFHLTSGYSWPSWIGEDAARYTSEIGTRPPELHMESKDAVLNLIKALDSRNFGLGVSCEHESRWRPHIVLFSRNDPVSEVLAGVVRSYFSWRQHRDHHSPILYVSDGATPYAPRCLSFGGHTIVVNGLDSIPVGDGSGEFYGYKNALKVVGTPDGLQFMGKRIPWK